MQTYHDNPFEVSRNQGDPDLNDYYDAVPAPSRSGGAFNNIPLSVVPPSAGASVPYRSLNGQSTDDLASGPPINRYGANPTNTRGFGMASAGYSPMGNDLNSGSHEPKLGAYASGSAWEAAPPKSSRKKWMVMGGIITIIAIIVIAVTAGVVVSNSKKKTNNLSSSGSSTSSSPAAVPSVVSQTNPNDPSTFVKDPNLHQSFYGLAYTPYGSQLPDCGNSLAAVIQDIQIMSQLTTRVRIYGADCNQSALLLEAIKQTKVNMTVYLANYAVATDNGTAYRRQRDEINAAVTTYGTAHIGGISVGNEFMLDYLDDNDATDPNGAVGNTGAAILIADIQDTQSNLTTMGVKIPVGTSDAGAYFNNEVMAAVDYGMANVHPWFANVSAQDGAAWTWTFFEQTDVALSQSLPNKPQMSIAETGWPTQSSDAGNASNGPSTASEANLQIFLDTFVCQANANGTEYFFFEFADESWKDVQFGGVEGWWGMFHQNRTMKNIQIPNCQAP
jgi:exo-beta-1,3-glucanase (GH17 family)